MSKEKIINTEELFTSKTLKETSKFVESLSPEEITKYRTAYRREMNQSNEFNQLPETTLSKRRCFIYLTSNYESR